MNQGSSRMLRGSAVAVAALVAFGIGVWRSGDAEAPPAPAELTPAETSGARAAETAAAVSDPAEPDHRISERGRLTLSANTMPMDRPLRLALDLADEARGAAPRAVRIGGSDGRELHVLASAAPGSGSGLRLEIDPAWLKPGHYLIEVKTAETSHFPLRRYSLIVK